MTCPHCTGDHGSLPCPTGPPPLDAPAYQRATYQLTRFEIVAPWVRNDGSPAPYVGELREALTEAGFAGWTEFDSRGMWAGKIERGTTFVIYADAEHTWCGDDGRLPTRTDPTRKALAMIGRACMPDQDAVQVVQQHGTVTLIEG